MALLDAIQFYAVSNGTADFVVNNAVTGFRSPTGGIATNNTVYSYRAESLDLSQWECGYGTWSNSTNTLARTTMVATSTGSKINFSLPPTVGITAFANDFIAASNTVTSNALVASNSSQQSDFRQKIYAAPIDALSYSGMQINGGMEISQEKGFNGTVTLTATGSLQYAHIIDGVTAAYRGSFVATGMQDWATAVSGYKSIYAIKIAVTTAQASLGANDELTVMFPIEGNRFVNRTLFGTDNAIPASLGFLISANRTGTYSGSVMNYNKTKSYPFFFTISSANTMTWVTVNIPEETTSAAWDNGVGVGAYICICLAGGTSRVGTAGSWATTTSPGTVGATGTTNGVGATSDVFRISNLICVPGSELPPADRVTHILRPYNLELSNCQRYFYNGEPLARGVVLSTSVLGRLACPHPVPMRINPSLSMTVPLGGYDGSVYGSASTIQTNSSGVLSLEMTLNMDMIDIYGGSSYTANRPACIFRGWGYGGNPSNINVDARLI